MVVAVVRRRNRSAATHSLLLERGGVNICAEARDAHAHHSRPYDLRGLEISEMPALLRQIKKAANGALALQIPWRRTVVGGEP
jgi:hypothetical protein